MTAILNIEIKGLIEKLIQGDQATKQLLAIFKVLNEFENKVKKENKRLLALY